jgi:flagellin
LIRIGSNIASLQAQRRLFESTDALARTYERLSSGQRINSAADDAAGLSVAERLRTDTRLSNVAVRNINDGISAVSIASSTLSQQSGILSRLSELAEQSANGTFSSTQRLTLNREYQELLSEFGRLGDSTEFNGNKLLRAFRTDGLSNLSIQAGTRGNNTSQISISLSDTGSLSGSINWAALATSDTNRDGFNDPTDRDYVFGPLSRDEIATIFGNSYVERRVYDAQGVEQTVIVGLMYDSAAETNFEAISFVKNSTTGLFEITAQGQSRYDRVFDNVSTSLSVNASTGTFNQSSVDINAGGGINFSLDLSGLRLLNAPSSGAAAGYGTALEFTGVDSSSRALSALESLKQRLSELALFQGRLGAFESRLSSAASLSLVASETLSAARSRITDADIADESAKLVRLQILQQAGAQVLSQANLQPQIALQLLR